MNRSNPVRTVGLVLACAAMLLFDASATAAQDLALQFRNGLVTLVARDVTIPNILDRWARIGGTTVINAETITGIPVTLQLVDVAERAALAILLRDVGGYILAERQDDLRGASVIDRILVLPRSTAPVRNLAPLPVVQQALPMETPENSQLEPAATEQSAQDGVIRPAPAGLRQGGSPVDGGAPFAPQGNMGTANMPRSISTGSARPGEITTVPPELYRPGATPAVRPGEMTAPQPPTRTSPGPQPPPQ